MYTTQHVHVHSTLELDMILARDAYGSDSGTPCMHYFSKENAGNVHVCLTLIEATTITMEF